MIMSEAFLKFNCPTFFGINVIELYETFVRNTIKRQPNAKDTCEAMSITNSSHIDETDMVLCQ